MVQTVLAQSAGTRARLQSLTAPLWQQHGWIHCSAGNVHVHVPLRFVFFQRQDQVGGKDSFSSKFICFNYYSYWEWTMECFLDLSWPKPSLSSVFPWPYPVTLGKLSLLLSFCGLGGLCCCEAPQNRTALGCHLCSPAPFGLWWICPDPCFLSEQSGSWCRVSEMT